jgi:formylglycine-generating enzyme required for sulfatase activity
MKAVVKRSFLLLALLPVWTLALAGTSCSHDAGGPAGADKFKTTLTRGGVEMVLVPGGTFEMGNGQGKEDERPVHTVTLASFWMDRTEVTQSEYERLGQKEAFANPSHFKGPKLPAEQITWAQAAYYCNARSNEEGWKPCYSESGQCDFSADGYRLPTEAEWEYACRAGSSRDYSFGAETRKLGDHSWYKANADSKTHEVGTRKPNNFGLHDMHGNVAEWCNDVYGKDYYAKSPAENPHGPTRGELYVIRGGSWKSAPDGLRSSYRIGADAGFSDACLARDEIGFRCVRNARNTERAE